MLAETVEEWTRQWKEDGLREGLKEGLQKGHPEGRQEGLLEGETSLLRKLLERRFGALPAWVYDKLAQAAPEQLEAWAVEILDAARLEDVFRGTN